MQVDRKIEEAELVSLLKDGDEVAFSYLYDHYSAALYGIIIKIISKEEVAEDVLQEVFVKVFTQIKNYDANKGRLYTWLLQVTRNTAIDTVRSKDFKKSKVIHELKNKVNDPITIHQLFLPMMLSGLIKFFQD